MKSSKPNLDVLMRAASSMPAKSRVADESVSHLPSDEVPLEALDELVNNSSYSAKAAPDLRETGNLTRTATTQVCNVQNLDYELDKEILIDEGLVVSEFEGNTRNSSQLRNIDELAASIIPAGHNSEPVKIRPMDNGSGFQLIKGKRRRAAVRRANELSVGKKIMLRCIISNIDDITALQECAMENTNNELMTPWEFADQLQALLDGNAATMEDINCYLPPDKKKAARTTIINWLHPARLDKNVRSYIDESKDVTNARITKLYSRVTKLFESGTEKAVLDKLAAKFLRGKHEVGELLRFFDSLEENENQRSISENRIIKNSAGRQIATVKQKSNGGLAVDFEKFVPKAEVDAVIELLDKHISAIGIND